MHSTDTTSDLERINPGIGEVTEEFGPCSLLLAGPVPDPGRADAVVSARTPCRVRTGHDWMTGRALMPEPADEASAGRGGDVVGECQTYAPSMNASAAALTSSRRS